ncbi:MAG: 5'/3'-nucleotidase SurE [Pseudomonadales bacterium]|nr:5'/3'-nucleotidase SurE [Pseudomonadales bacterium]
MLRSFERTMRRALLLLFAWVIGVPMAPGSTAVVQANQSECLSPGLDILLTNDDGYDTPWIEALHRAFTTAGHRVKRIAPSENYSGGSAALSIRPVSVARVPSDEFTEVYAVDATPATSVLLGATALFGPDTSVDLVISGINEGANLGPATPISGTVGATIVATQVLEPVVPAIAFSSNPIGDDPGSAESRALGERIAGFGVRLVEALQRSSCATASPLLPPGIALNVNYPALAPDAIRGVRWARQSTLKSFGLGFARVGEDLYAPVFERQASGASRPDGDTELFAQGYVTVVALDGDYSIAPDALPALDGLSP